MKNSIISLEIGMIITPILLFIISLFINNPTIDFIVFTIIYAIGGNKIGKSLLKDDVRKCSLLFGAGPFLFWILVFLIRSIFFGWTEGMHSLKYGMYFIVMILVSFIAAGTAIESKEKSGGINP